MEAINYDIRNMKNDIDILLKRTRNYEDSVKLVNNLEAKLEKRLTDMGTQGVQRRFQNRIDELEKDLVKFIDVCMKKNIDINNKIIMLNNKFDINDSECIQNLQIRIRTLVDYKINISTMLKTVYENTLIPTSLLNNFNAMIDTYINEPDEPIFHHEKEGKVLNDFSVIVKNKYSSKRVHTYTQWVTMNEHLNEIDMYANLLHICHDGYYDKCWQDSIQKLISYIDTLPSKSDDTKIMTQIENIDISKQEKIISQDSANLISNTNTVNVTKNEKNEITTLTTDNLLEKCVEYTKIYKPDVPCILQVLQHMLSSKQYVLSKDMFDKKLNLEQINKDFKLQAYQDLLTEDDLISLLFI